MTDLQPLTTLNPARFDSPAILKKVAATIHKLAELKCLAAAIPNQKILINLMSLQEARNSAAVDNIIATNDEIFMGEVLPESMESEAISEILRYRKALLTGFDIVRTTGTLSVFHILIIQSELVGDNAGFRKLAGIVLKDMGGHPVYTPPQNTGLIVTSMDDLERFINQDRLFPADSLVKMALIHHQFESIRPFYDGNGRIGRIINVLYLVKKKLLDIPALCLSRHIMQTRADYCRLLQAVHDQDAWEEWVLYMLDIVERSATDAIATVQTLKAKLQNTRNRIRNQHNFYSQALIDTLFVHPYTNAEIIKSDLNIPQLTAVQYLEALTADGILEKRKVGHNNYYINRALNAILTGRHV